MPTDSKIESYLNELDDALSAIPTSERAEIITEIKSHIFEAQGREPQKAIDEILRSFGDATTVAARYLQERGLPPGRKRVAPTNTVKWVVIGLLGLFAISAASMTALIYRFMPLVEVDEKAGKVSLMGGMIQVNEDDAKEMGVAFSKMTGGQSAKKIIGTYSVPSEKPGLFKLGFTNGKFTFSTSKDDTAHWACKVISEKDRGDFIKKSQGSIIFDLNDYTGASCEISLPKHVAINIVGKNGKIEIDSPHSAVQVKLDNGSVGLHPTPSLQYRYKTEVKNGKMNTPASSDRPGAIPVEITLTNGMINIE